MVAQKLFDHGLCLCEFHDHSAELSSYSRKSELDVALSCFEISCLLDPSNSLFILWSGIASRLSGKFLQSAERLSQLLHSQDNVRFEANSQLCLALNDMGVEIACNMNPDSTVVQNKNGWFLQACNCFRQAISLAHNMPWRIKMNVHINFGTCLTAGGEMSSAIEQFQIALNFCSTQSDLLCIRKLISQQYHAKGLEKIKDGNISDALTELTRALCYNSEDQEVKLDRAKLYMDVQMWKEAQNDLKSIILSRGPAGVQARKMLNAFGGENG